MAVSESDRKPASLKSGRQVHHPEHLHSVRGNGVFLPDYADLPEAECLDQLLCGVAIGIGGALVVVRSLSSTINGMLYGIKPTDISLFAGATFSLVAIALLAAFLPTRRAMKVDPMVALRYE